MNQNVLLTIAASVGPEAGDVNTSGALRRDSAQGIHEKSSKSMGTENPVLTRSITTIVLKPLMSGFS